LYSGRDADDPTLSSNDFTTPPGASSCCEFLVTRDSLSGDGSHAVNSIPAVITPEHVRSIAVTPVRLTIDVGTPPRPVLSLQRAVVELSRAGDGTLSGRIGGVIPMQALAGIINSRCSTANVLCPSGQPSST